jgi:hypothetical protein
MDQVVSWVILADLSHFGKYGTTSEPIRDAALIWRLANAKARSVFF